jgi:hypothetical protein
MVQYPQWNGPASGAGISTGPFLAGHLSTTVPLPRTAPAEDDIERARSSEEQRAARDRHPPNDLLVLLLLLQLVLHRRYVPW